MGQEVFAITTRSEKGITTAPESDRSPKLGPTVFQRSNGKVEGIINDNYSAIPLAPAQKAEDEYVNKCYARLLELKETHSDNRPLFRQGLGEILEHMAQESGKYSTAVNSLLMKHWMERNADGVVPYDEHMKDHVQAIDVLIRAWTKDKYLNTRKIQIFDASCGTGKVIEAFLNSLPEEVLSRVSVVANDVSSAAMEIAKENLKKFEGKVKIEFTRLDITKQLPPGQFDIVILSQTLPFIVSDKVLRSKRLQQTTHKDEERHITAKTTLFESLIKKKLKPDIGEFLLIDEDPMKLSKPPDDIDGLIDDLLFDEICRKISEATIIGRMKEIKSAKFAGHIKVPIDRDHDMYLMSYTRPSKRVNNKGIDDNDSEMKVIHAIERFHPILAERIQAFPKNEQVVCKPIIFSGQRLTIDPGYYKNRIEGNPNYWKKNGSNNVVIINGLVHALGIDSYKQLIDSLKTSKKAEPGASLVFIDRFPTPGGISNAECREMAFRKDDHQFAAAFRHGNTYGYLYIIESE